MPRGVGTSVSVLCGLGGVIVGAAACVEMGSCVSSSDLYARAVWQPVALSSCARGPPRVCVCDSLAVLRTGVRRRHMCECVCVCKPGISRAT